MQSIDFYIFPHISIEMASTEICRLVENFFQQTRHIYIQAPDETTAKYFDNALWTFRDISFVPHTLVTENMPTPANILIGLEYLPEIKDILFNLTTKIPPSFDEFTQLCEIVLGNEDQKKAGRNRYKHYLQLGYKPTVHKI